MKKKKILVVGSTNTDMVVTADHLPKPGETVLGGSFIMNPGGKGANQAVAAARSGGDVTFICKTGNDSFGIGSRQLFMNEGINVSSMMTDNDLPSGVALIMVDKSAENCIAVASGANGNLTPDDIKSSEKSIFDADIILMQLEIPIETVEFVTLRASELGKKVILNPAPARTIPESLLNKLFLITPNETEAEIITGIRVFDEITASKAAKKLFLSGVKNVIITLGSKGAMIYNETVCELVPAHKVKAIDTTAAGDVFNGALATAISEDMTLIDAVRFSCKAAAISVTRPGAQSSAPFRNEIKSFL
jgi:ribokinase